MKIKSKKIQKKSLGGKFNNFLDNTGNALDGNETNYDFRRNRAIAINEGGTNIGKNIGGGILGVASSVLNQVPGINMLSKPLTNALGSTKVGKTAGFKLGQGLGNVGYGVAQAIGGGDDEQTAIKAAANIGTGISQGLQGGGKIAQLNNDQNTSNWLNTTGTLGEQGFQMFGQVAGALGSETGNLEGMKYGGFKKSNGGYESNNILEKYKLLPHSQLNPNFANAQLDGKPIQMEKNETIFRAANGGKFKTENITEQDISKQVGTSSGSGSGKEKEIKATTPFTVTQITKTNPNLQGYKLPQETIVEMDKSINQYISTEGKGLETFTNDKGQTEFRIPINATIDQINEIQAKNAKLAETQTAKQNLVDINNIVASKNGFTANANGEYDVLSQIPKNLQVELRETINRVSQSEYDPITQSYIQPDPEYIEKEKQRILKKDPRFAKYINELEAISKGIQLTGTNAYPLVGDAFKDVNAGIMNLLTQKTNYFDGNKGEIEYLQNNDKIDDKDKEYISKLVGEKGLSELNGRTAIFFDDEKGQYSALAIFPRSKADGGDIYLKIGQKLLGGLPTEAMALDPIYNEASSQLFRKSYQDHSQKTNNIHGRIGGVTKDIETTHIMANDIDNKANKLNTGETVFTLPELPNIVVKVGAFDAMDKFYREYEATKPQGTALLDLLKSNGMTPITSPGFYNRYKSRELKPSFAPKQ